MINNLEYTVTEFEILSTSYQAALVRVPGRREKLKTLQLNKYSKYTPSTCLKNNVCNSGSQVNP